MNVWFYSRLMLKVEKKFFKWALWKWEPNYRFRLAKLRPLGMVACPCHPSPRRWRQKGQDFRVVLDYIESL